MAGHTAAWVGVAVVMFLFLFGCFEVVSYEQTSISLDSVGFEGLTFLSSTPTSIVSEALRAYAAATSPTFESIAEAVAGVISRVELSVTLSFTDSGLMPVYYPSESHQVFLNGLFAGTGSTPGFWVVRGGTTKVTFTETIDSAGLVPIVKSAMLSGGRLKVDVLGSTSAVGASFPFSLEQNVDLINYLSQKIGVNLPMSG